ncbi:MAG TPA: transposase [Chloroflexota bacterium]|nr:transposase [Chloroflexota bacterium]
MESVTLWQGAVYRHRAPTLLGPLACPACGTPPGAPRHTRARIVEHPDADQPTYLVVRVPQYPCVQPACPQKYFTPPIQEAAPYAHTSRRLQQSAVAVYRQGRAPLRAVATEFQTQWHTRTSKSSVLRWHQATLAHDYPRPERLPFSGVLCIDEVSDRVAGQKRPVFTCVDPLARLTLRIPVERADAAHLAAAMHQVRALGAQPRVIVSDLWAAYPEALAAVWPQAERQRCWFHVMQWVTRQLARLLKQYGATLPPNQRRELQRLRFLLLASPEKQQRLGPRARAALARAWELIADSIVAEAIQLRNDLRAVLNTSTTRAEAREQFAQLRQSWPARFQPWTWRPGTPLSTPTAPATEGTTGLREYLEAIMAFFVRHFEMMITYLEQPGVPRTNNHAERDNRRWRAVARPRYGWATARGQRAMLIALQGFDSS